MIRQQHHLARWGGCRNTSGMEASFVDNQPTQVRSPRREWCDLSTLRAGQRCRSSATAGFPYRTDHVLGAVVHALLHNADADLRADAVRTERGHCLSYRVLHHRIARRRCWFHWMCADAHPHCESSPTGAASARSVVQSRAMATDDDLVPVYRRLHGRPDWSRRIGRSADYRSYRHYCMGLRLLDRNRDARRVFHIPCCSPCMRATGAEDYCPHPESAQRARTVATAKRIFSGQRPVSRSATRGSTIPWRAAAGSPVSLALESSTKRRVAETSKPPTSACFQGSRGLT